MLNIPFTDYRIIPCRGTSMIPTIPHNSIVIFKEKDEYSIGDVIAYKHINHTGYIVHRIVNKRETYFETKGDNEDIVDTNIENIYAKPHRILGEAKYVISADGAGLVE